MDGKESRSLPTQFSRRQAIALGLKAAAGAGALGVAGLHKAAAQVPGDDIAGFKVDIPGAPVASRLVAEVLIDDLHIDTLPTTDGAGALGSVTRRLGVAPVDLGRLYGPGQSHYGRATFVIPHVLEAKREMDAWIAGTSSGQCVRKNITVTLFRADGTPGRTYTLLGAEPAQGSALGLDQSGTPRLAYPLQMSGVEFGAPSDPAPGAARGFMVEISDAGKLEADFWWGHCDGGGEMIASCDDHAGREFHNSTPGHKYIDVINLRGPMTGGRKALCTWINDTVNGRQWKRTVTVKEILKDGAAGKTYTYHDCFPTRYKYPVLSADGTGNLYEEVSIKPERLEVS